MIHHLQTVDMAQKLRAMAILTEDLGLIYSIHMVAHNGQGICYLLAFPGTTQACGVYIHFRQNTHKHVFSFSFWNFKTGFHCISLAALELANLALNSEIRSSLPPKCWG